MKNWLKYAATAALVVGMSAPALAQDTTTDDTTSTSGDAFGSMSTSTTTTTGIAITVGPFLTTSLLAGGAASADKMQQYMRDNAVALQHDINLGGGQTTADLAQIFGVEAAHRSAFGALLRQHRDQLLPLTNTKKLDRTRTIAFVRTIHTAMKQDARFATAIKRIGAQG